MKHRDTHTTCRVCETRKQNDYFTRAGLVALICDDCPIERETVEQIAQGIVRGEGDKFNLLVRDREVIENTFNPGPPKHKLFQPRSEDFLALSALVIIAICAFVIVQVLGK
jgi:hypothetical protein